MSARPPRWFERVLRRSGRDTMMGEAAADDLRQEWTEWRASRPAWRADLRYRREALRIAFGLRLSGLGGGIPGARRTRPAGLVSSAARDLRYGLRGLARAPLYTAVAAGTLALGVGATVAIFTAVQTILLDPLPYTDPDALHAIEINTGGDGWYGASVPEFLDLESELSDVARVAAFSAGAVTMGDSLSPVRVRAVFASASLLPMLGVQPAVGRLFRPDEETPDNNRFVLLSDALWRDAYGADPTLVGRTVPLFGQAYLVLGVMPASFAFPDTDTRAWFPFGINRQSPNPRNNHFLRVVARLREDGSSERAAAQLQAYSVRARSEYPEIYSERGFRLRMRTLHETVVGDVRTPLLLLMASVALVLVVACLNVVNLCVSRTEARRRELAVRAAIGATRSRLVRQLLGESLLLGFLGGAGGVALAAAAVWAITRFAPASLPRVEAIQLGPLALLLALAIAVAAAAAFAIVPAMRVLAREGQDPLSTMGRGVVAKRSGRRFRRLLLSSQVALASVVAVGAGLMLRTLQNLRHVDPGFVAAGGVAISVSPAFNRYPAPEARAALWHELTARVRSIPGVVAAGGTSALPLTDLYDNLSIRVEGRVTTSVGDAPDARIQRVTPGLIEALGVRVLEGRAFTDADRTDGRPVTIVGETFAKRFWPGEAAVGKTVRVFADGYPWMEVVGVVADLAHDRLDVAPEAMWYVPHAQAQNAYGIPLQLFMVVRADGPPAALVPRIREAVADVDPTIAVSGVQFLDDLLDQSLAVRGFTYELLRAFGLVALILVFIGVYGVATLSVAERRAEIGLRKTLGAQGGAIVGLVARETLLTVALGALVGLAGSLAATRLIESLLYGVEATDGWTLIGTVLTLGAMTVGAVLLPTLRALQIEPLTAMRSEE